jgi:hypothetical protein
MIACLALRSQFQRSLFVPLRFRPGRFLKGFVHGGDVGGAFDVFAVHQFLDRAELDARVFLLVHFVLVTGFMVVWQTSLAANPKPLAGRQA